MAKVVPDSLIAHYTDFVLLPPDESDIARAQNGSATPEELQYIAAVTVWVTNHTAYSDVHQKSPLLAAQVLTDSPVGFAGWVWHLLYAVSDGYAYTLKQVIDRSMLLWIQGTYGGLRTYRELQYLPVSKFSTILSWLATDDLPGSKCPAIEDKCTNWRVAMGLPQWAICGSCKCDFSSKSSAAIRYLENVLTV